MKNNSFADFIKRPISGQKSSDQHIDTVCSRQQILLCRSVVAIVGHSEAIVNWRWLARRRTISLSP
jgi:hypothetical protein